MLYCDVRKYVVPGVSRHLNSNESASTGDAGVIERRCLVCRSVFGAYRVLVHGVHSKLLAAHVNGMRSTGRC